MTINGTAVPTTTKPKRQTKPPPVLLADAKQLGAILGGLGLRTIRTMDAAGKLPKPLRLGGRVLWDLREIRRWIDAGAPDRQAWETLKRAKGKQGGG